MTRAEVYLGDVIRAWAVLGGSETQRRDAARLLGFDVDPSRIATSPISPSGPRPRSGPDRSVGEVPLRAPTQVGRSAPSVEPTAPVAKGTRISAYRRHLRPAGLMARPRRQAPGAIHVMLPGHNGRVVAAAFSPDGELVATVGVDRRVRRTVLRTGHPAGPTLSVANLASTVALANDGTVWVGLQGAGFVRLRAPGDFQPVATVAPTALASAPGDVVFVGTDAGDLVVVEGTDPVETLRFSATRAPVIAVAGAGTRDLIAVADIDGRVTVIERSTGRLVRTLALGGRPVALAVVGDGTVVAVDERGRAIGTGGPSDATLLVPGEEVRALSPDGARIVTTDADGTVRVRERAAAAAVKGFLSPPADELPPPAPDLPPLFAPRVSAGLVSLMLATPAAGESVDLDALVDLVARRHTVARLPTIGRRSQSRGVQVLVDHGVGMRPFDRDATILVDVLRRVLGPGLVDERRITATPFHEYSPPYIPPPPGRPVLVLSDLGIANTPGTPPPRHHARDWERLAALLQRRGSELIALVPYPPRRRPSHLLATLTMINWDRSTSLREVRSARETAFRARS